MCVLCSRVGKVVDIIIGGESQDFRNKHEPRKILNAVAMHRAEYMLMSQMRSIGG